MGLNVSRLLDGQIDDWLVESVMDEVTSNGALRDRFTIYGLVGDALRGNATPDDGFTSRILERMRRGGVMIEPDFDPLDEETLSG